MRIFLLLFIVFTNISLAEEESQTRQMIKAIQQASDEDRFELMNAFKKHLREMNAKQRQEAIMNLQKSLAVTQGANEQEQNQQRVRNQTQLQESQKQMQMQNQRQNQLQGNGAGPGMMKKP